MRLTSYRVPESLVQTGWETQGIPPLGGNPLKTPNGAAAGGSRLWHLQIWCWRYFSYKCYRALQSDTRAPTFSNVIMPSTPTPPTFALQLFLDSLFCQTLFLVHFSILFSIDFFYSGLDGHISSQPVCLENKSATVCRPCGDFRLLNSHMSLGTSSWRTLRSSHDLRFFAALPPTPCVTLGGMVETGEGKVMGFLVKS